MSEPKPRDPDFARRVQDSFARQRFMRKIAARLVHVAPGVVDITVANDTALHQQHGHIHGGVLISVADSAAGYAALSLASPGTEVLTTELKVNFLRPAGSEQIVARGRVIKPGVPDRGAMRCFRQRTQRRGPYPDRSRDHDAC